MFSECPPFEAQKGGGSTHLRQEQRVFWIQLLPREVPALCASPPEARGAQAKADLWPPPPPTSTTATAAALLAPAQRQCPQQLLRGTPFLAGSCLLESRTPQGPPRTYSSTPCCAHSHAATARPDILASGRLTTPGPRSSSAPASSPVPGYKASASWPSGLQHPPPQAPAPHRTTDRAPRPHLPSTEDPTAADSPLKSRLPHRPLPRTPPAASVTALCGRTALPRSVAFLEDLLPSELL